MTEVCMLAIDLAKGSFQVSGVGSDGRVVFNKAISRPRLYEFLAAQRTCVVAMEVCATSHHWVRVAQSRSHEVRLVPAAYVKPFVKRQKMGWLPPSPDGIAMCQGRGVQGHAKEMTANERYSDRCGSGKERLPASRGQRGRTLEVSKEGDSGPVSTVHVEARTCRRGPTW